HAPAPAVRRLVPDVEAEIDLLEIAVPGNGNAAHPGGQEEEAHDAHERPPLPEIDLRAPWHQRRQNLRRHLVVEHREIPPAGGEEGTGGRHASLPYKPINVTTIPTTAIEPPATASP